ncbi:hypothetical protein [Chryseobacterium sp.]|uniref:hypothetical protein n=2 Tax=unclassified Chryseobacterium TaxID=2593645 RepID=UPI00289BEC35|nr:hypothetical protein [Chryseobacterium sp.]
MMKKTLGIILILLGFCLTVVIKIGPSKETSWLFGYGDLPPMLLAVALIIPGLILYNKNR